MFKSKVFLVEFIGTFALVFIGASSGIVSGGNIVAMALAYGLTLAVFNYAYGYISGMHMNPAVTFAMALQGAVKWGEAVVSYWIPQFVGAIAGAFLLKFFLDPLSTQAFAGAASVGALNADYPLYAMVVEVLFTFFLVSTVLHTVVGGKGGQMAGLAIGLTYAIAILSAGPLSGGSLNPARTFGPALFTGEWKTPTLYLIYFLGPLLGALIAVAAYQFLTSEDKVEEEEVDEDEEEKDEVELSAEEAEEPKA
ncbi:MAG: aquaporin [Anaerolineales bacterium]